MRIKYENTAVAERIVPNCDAEAARKYGVRFLSEATVVGTVGKTRALNSLAFEI